MELMQECTRTSYDNLDRIFSVCNKPIYPLTLPPQMKEMRIRGGSYLVFILCHIPGICQFLRPPITRRHLAVFLLHVGCEGVQPGIPWERGWGGVVKQFEAVPVGEKMPFRLRKD